MRIASLATLFLFCGILMSNIAHYNPQKVEIRGIYGHPRQLWDKGYNLSDLGVNAVFLHDKSITEDFIQRTRKEGAKIFAEFATLNGKGYVEDHPEAWAIDSSGKKVEPATWFMGVCPTDPGFRKSRTDELKHLLQQYDVDGVWMDYVHWHAQFEDPDPILPETCFCNKCTDKFSQQTSKEVRGESISQKARFILNNQDSAWRNWRCAVIADWVKEFKEIVKKEKPQALLGLYHCPWSDSDFNNARYRTLGLDFAMLKNNVDVFSPMVYHKRMGRQPAWVKENIEWLSGEVDGTKIWPIVQASDEPAEVSPEEFENVLRYGLSGNATGVMMFTTNAVAEDAAKISVMKKMYNSLK
jgi:hypothetical protein